MEILEIDILAPPEKFPDAVRLPEEIVEAREKRYKEISGSALRGVMLRSIIATVELLAALIFGSSSLFMDALSTGLDIGTSLVLLLSFKLAAKPPDTQHPLGHGRFEPLAGLQLGLFLLFVGGGMFFFNIAELNRVDPYNSIPGFLWVIPFGSFILLEVAYRLILRAAKRQHSPALEADAIHYRIDSITSVFATIALSLGSFSPRFSEFFDHMGAAFIAIFMVIVGCNAARKNLNQLIDRIPDREYFKRVKEAAFKAEGVLGTEKIRMQLYGPDAHVDIDVEVDPKLSVEKAHLISQKVRLEIQKELPLVRDVIVHLEPYYPNDHHE